MKPTFVLLSLLCLPLSSCVLYRADKVKVDHPIVEIDGGVQIREIMQGQGPAAIEGDDVTIDYIGFLSDGSQFDSSIERGVPVEFTLGQAPLPGWNHGVLGMKAGGSRRVQLPPCLAYGEQGVEGLIPPNEVLVFEIELLSIGSTPSE
jgi:FKBP-type peptidyl-prolyl cis-trans isomerase